MKKLFLVLGILCAQSASAVEIDLSKAKPSITGNKKIHLDNVKVENLTMWMDLSWNAAKNSFEVSNFGPGNGSPSCAGFEFGGACWFTAPKLNMTCNQVCEDKGGFNVEGSRHTGNDVGKHFWPDKTDGNADWESVECSSTDNNTNWGANGALPDGEFYHEACYVSCACNGSSRAKLEERFRKKAPAPTHGETGR